MCWLRLLPISLHCWRLLLNDLQVSIEVYNWKQKPLGMGGSFHVLLALARRICLLYISTKTGCCSSFVCIQLLRDNYPLLLFNNSNFYFLYSLLWELGSCLLL